MRVAVVRMTAVRITVGRITVVRITVGIPVPLAVPISIKFSDAPAGDTILGVKAGDTLQGFHLDHSGQEQVNKYMYLALGKPNGASPATFDDAAADFLLVACAKAGGPCDFSGVISNADADAVTEIALE